MSGRSPLFAYFKLILSSHPPLDLTHRQALMLAEHRGEDLTFRFQARDPTPHSTAQNGARKERRVRSHNKPCFFFFGGTRPLTDRIHRVIGPDFFFGWCPLKWLIITPKWMAYKWKIPWKWDDDQGSHISGNPQLGISWKVTWQRAMFSCHTVGWNAERICSNCHEWPLWRI